LRSVVKALPGANSKMLDAQGHSLQPGARRSATVAYQHGRSLEMPAQSAEAIDAQGGDAAATRVT